MKPIALMFRFAMKYLGIRLDFLSLGQSLNVRLREMPTRVPFMKMSCFGLVLLALTITQPKAFAEANDPFRHTLQVTGRGEGSYNIRATVQPTPTPVPFEQQSPARREAYIRSLFGETLTDAPATDPDTEFLVNQALDLQTAVAEEKKRRAQQAAARSSGSTTGSGSSRPSSSGSSSSRSSGSSSSTPSRSMGYLNSPYQLMTDGSIGSDLLTETAIDTFYYGLPNDIATALYNLSHDRRSPSAADDPYVDYAQAMHNGDFQKMRDLANSPYISDWNERINMLGTAGAAALRNLSDPQNPNKTAAKDALQRIAEDLQYAGQGLDANDPNNNKLRTICAEISRIWSNMTQPPGSQPH